ncbi:hypothetical protein NPIL_468971 [Nephila pilipes]|uniref:Uncharacterized protein n=1 Tax=Nephila pilipes TaxID=299642 RepID=A0A8X6TAV9_NEPPI|nr:hypothetical protein NPIL_468971 [Nephila pilipes]
MSLIPASLGKDKRISHIQQQFRIPAERLLDLVMKEQTIMRTNKYLSSFTPSALVLLRQYRQDKVLEEDRLLRRLLFTMLLIKTTVVKNEYFCVVLLKRKRQCIVISFKMQNMFQTYERSVTKCDR